MKATRSWRQIHPDLAVTLSVGLSERNGLGTFEQVLQAADTRLYEAKTSGRNRVRF